MWENFHFLRPWWLLALIVPLIVYRNFFGGLKNISAWEAVCDKKLLDFLLIKGSSKQRSFMGYMVILGLCGAVLALSGPAWVKRSVPAFEALNPVMILLNLSSDMDQKDVPPDRLNRAKFAISDFLRNLKAQTGLIVYSSEPYLISPVSDDKKIILNLLPAVSRDIVPTNGDRLDRAIEFAVERLEESGYSSGNLVVFSNDCGQEFAASLTAAQKAFKKGFRVNAVAVNAKTYDKLELLVSKGGGEIMNINENLDDLSNIINEQASSDMKESANKTEAWEDGGYWFLSIVLICVLFFFRRGILVAALIYCTSAHAGFFTNADQDGLKAFQNNDFNAAAETFHDNNWKASSYYRKKDFANALKFYEKSQGVEALYNQGNALAKSGKIDEAIKKYEEVLKQVSDHEDAKFNLEYLKNKQQEQSQSQAQDKKQNSDTAGEKKSNNEKNDGDKNNSGNDEKNDNNSQNQDNADSSSSQEQNKADEADNQSNGQSQKGDANSSLSEAKNDDNSQASDNGVEKNVRSSSEAGEKSDEEADNQGGTTDKGDFSEEMQAREMMYRNIPDDAGGLLRAFIYKEYNKNRYGDK
ncbi:MAG: tetratricopeptide repeat protein [Alphaproteobacteria bacterium]|nr:tetratricopeptide repeat protein [Alphaproteobacteria bacterium]